MRLAGQRHIAVIELGERLRILGFAADFRVCEQPATASPAVAIETDRANLLREIPRNGFI
jgi:hypothetical protein